jgi:hypothetical protein
MRFITQDGLKFEAETDEELVREMRKSAFLKGDTVEDYMKLMAARVSSDIATDSAEEFVAGLISAGFLKEIEK